MPTLFDKAFSRSGTLVMSATSTPDDKKSDYDKSEKPKWGEKNGNLNNCDTSRIILTPKERESFLNDKNFVQ